MFNEERAITIYFVGDDTNYFNMFLTGRVLLQEK